MTTHRHMKIILLNLLICIAGHAQNIKSFSRTPCKENCKKNDTLYFNEIKGNTMKLSFGRLEDCNYRDTALTRTRNDTLLIRTGEKKHIGLVTFNNKTFLDFKAGDADECFCYYDYVIEVTDLNFIQKALIVDNKIFIDNKGFRRYKLQW
jgi:hypothetical protein